MASIAAYFASAAINAAPHLQALYLVDANITGMVRLWILQGHDVGKRVSGLAADSACLYSA